MCIRDRKGKLSTFDGGPNGVDKIQSGICDALLLDDLLDWSDWFYRERVLAPWGLVARGSDEVHYQDYSEHAMQGARFESGLDNSPMYDGEFYDSS